MTAIIVCVAASVTLGLVANRFLRQRVIADDEQGPGPDVLLVPVTTFAALFIAFVLAQATSTYTASRQAAAAEANVVDNMFETAEFLKGDRFKVRIQASLVCYARSIAGPEWTAMGKGNNSTQGAVASNWTGTGPNGLRLTFQQMGVKHPFFRRLTDLDRSRGDTRRARLAYAEPQVPKVVASFMLLLIFAAVFGLAFYIPRVNNTSQRITVVIVGVVFVMSLGLIRNLDRPYQGLLRIPPKEMMKTSTDIDEDFVEVYDVGQLPCDARGAPLEDS